MELGTDLGRRFLARCASESRSCRERTNIGVPFTKDFALKKHLPGHVLGLKFGLFRVQKFFQLSLHVSALIH